MNKEQSEVLQLLKELIAIPSINPMGEYVDGAVFYEGKIGSYIEDYIKRHGIELIKQKEILLNIEKISNRMEDVSDVVKTIIVKYA